jgi:hypothetical protein
MQAFGLEASQMGMITDVMADSFSSSALDMNKFETAMSSVAPVAKGAGASLQQTTAILGVLVNNGVEASTAGTALRNIFLDLEKEGMTMSEAMDQIQNSTSPLAESMEMFGKRGATVATILANNGDAVKNLTADFIDSKGEAQDMADIMGSGLGGSLKELQSQFEGLLIQLGEVLVPIFEKLMGFASKLIGHFTNLSSEQKKLGVALGLIAAAIGPLMVVFGKLFALIGTVGLPIILKIAALVAIGKLIFDNWSAVKKVLVDVINYFIDLYNESIVFRGAVEGITLAFKTAYANVMFFVKTTWILLKELGANIKGLFGGIGDLIAGVFTFDMDRFKKGFTQIGDSLGATFDPRQNPALKTAIKEHGETLANNLTTAIDNTLGNREPVEYVTEEDIDAGIDKLKEMGGKMKDTLMGVFDGGGGGGGEILDMSLLTDGAVEEATTKLTEISEKNTEIVDGMKATWTSWGETTGERIAGALERFKGFMGEIKAIEDMKFNADMERLNQQEQKDIERIENSKLSAQEKEDAIIDIEKAADDERKSLTRKKAKSDKKFAIFTALVDAGVAIAKTLASVPFPANIAASVLIGGLAKAQVDAIKAQPLPALAEGGLAFGPTAALVGDNPNAGVDPEVIAPLSKLKNMIGNSGRVIVEGVIKGADIHLSNQRYNRKLATF